MKSAPFEYHRAHSIDEAVTLLARGGEDAKVLAGGQSLVAMMNFRLARPSVLVDINNVPGISHILAADGGLRIGALVRHADIEHYPAILEGFDVLPESAHWVGHYPIRARGTFGGSIAHADAAAEWCILAVLFQAQVVAVGASGSRLIPIAEFFRGPFSTALQPDEILVEVRFPRGYAHAALTEYARRQGDFALVAAAVGYDVEDNLIKRPRVVLGGVAAQPLFIPAATELLEGERPGRDLFREAGQVAARELDPPADIHADSNYRRHLAAVLVERALGTSVVGQPALSTTG